MPFGELFGMVVFAVALLDAYPKMHSVIFFTDATQRRRRRTRAPVHLHR